MGQPAVILFRPVGLEELRLIYEADRRAFPPRLPDQPIFYPVLNEPYAAQIAREWNTLSGTRAGFVTRFEVADRYVAKFERRVVGGREHEELWVPAEELAEFNAQIVAPIVVTAAFFGDDYQGWVPEDGPLAGKNADEQFVALAALSRENALAEAVTASALAVYLNVFFWERGDFLTAGAAGVLTAIRKAWSQSCHAAIPLGVDG
jgi:hypothetical protein